MSRYYSDKGDEEFMAKAKHCPQPGDRFGMMTVEGNIEIQNGVRVVVCQCDCGTRKSAAVGALVRGRITSCGCGRTKRAIMMGKLSRTHGQTAGYHHGRKRSPTYISWCAMNMRCNNPNATGYQNYGGRGIRVCDRWSGTDGFENFASDMGDRPNGATLDRIDNDGDYCPNNCQWLSASAQSKKRRNVRLVTWKGQTKPIADWARDDGVTVAAIHYRIKHGLPLSSTPKS